MSHHRDTARRALDDLDGVDPDTVARILADLADGKDHGHD